MTTEKKATTHDLIMQARALSDILDEVECDDEAIEKLQSWMNDSDSKMTSLAIAKRILEREQAQWQAEADRYVVLVKRKQRDIDRVKDLTAALLRANEELTGDRKMHTADGGWVRLDRRTTKSVVVDELGRLPPSLIQVIPKAIKRDIKALLEDGVEVPGAHLETRTSESVRWSK